MSSPKYIADISQIEVSTDNGGVNIIRVTYTDNTWNDFYVRNGNGGSGGVRGSKWYFGIEMVSQQADVEFVCPTSGVPNALEGDIYFNTSTSGIYYCVLGGNPSVARWVYKGSSKGKNGVNAAIDIAGIYKNIDSQLKLSSNENRKLISQATKELKGEIFDPDGYFQTDKFSATLLETLMLYVGSDSTNFELENVVLNVNALNSKGESDPNLITNLIGGDLQPKLIHFGISDSDINTWILDVQQAYTKDEDGDDFDDNTAYYLYAKAPVNSESHAQLLFSKNQYRYNQFAKDESNPVYYFLIGVLSTVLSINDARKRVLTMTYGTTTINGEFIRTGVISSNNGDVKIDLNKGIIYSRNGITFTKESGEEAVLTDYIGELLNEGFSSFDETIQGFKNTLGGFGDTLDGFDTTINNLGNKLDNLENNTFKDYKYILDCLKNAESDGTTTISGGLVLTSAIVLKNTHNQLKAGINGVLGDDDAKAIAAWFGGNPVDKLSPYTPETAKGTAATTLFRGDGTGYFAGGKFWWDEDGQIHADPTSFILGKDADGNNIQLIDQFVALAGEQNITGIKRFINGLRMCVPHTANSLDGLIEWDDEKRVFRFNGNVVATGDVIAYGVNPKSVQTINDLIVSILEDMKLNGEISSGAGIAAVTLDYDSELYKFRVHIKDVNNKDYYSEYIDLPLESVVVNGSYDNTNKRIILTLQNGSSVNFPVGDLVLGLASESFVTSAVAAEAGERARVDDTKLNISGSNATSGSAISIISKLNDNTADSTSDDYYVARTKTSFGSIYNFKPISSLWNFIQNSISSALGLTAESYGGNSASADKLKNSVKLWSQDFDGSSAVDGSIVSTGTVKSTGTIIVNTSDGTKIGNITVDANGRFVFDKGIISKEDIIAYGVGGEDVKSVTDVIEEYLSKHGIGGGGLSSVVIGSSGSGNVVSGMSKTLSDDGKTLTLTLTKGISAYVKPSTGIPLADLASSVQASLGKADTALQEHQSLAGYATERWVEGKGYLTAHQDISGKADKTSTVSTIAYDSTNKKITKTINGTTSDVVSVATLKSAMDAVTSTDLGNAISGEVQARINAINELDVASAGGSEKYIQSISQTDGKISATAATLNKSAVGLGNVDNTADANKNVEGANHILSLGNQTMITGITKPTKTGISLVQVYNNGYTVPYGNVINVRGGGSGQILCEWTGSGGDTGHLYYRSLRDNTDEWTSWKKVAFIGDNTASATKLQTARTLWGNSFDGSANIDGTITMGEGTGGRTVKLTNSGMKFIATSQNGWAMNLVARNHADSSDLATLIGGYGTADTYYYTYLGGTYNNPSMVILPNGNVGIGTSNPTSKLRVIGSAQIDGLNLNDCSLSDTGNITPKSTNAKNIGSSTLLYAGVYANAYRANADELYITNTKSQKDIGFWINNGTGNSQRMLIRGSDGAVGIGSSSPSYKLHVAGGSVYSDTAIRVPNGKPFASKLANGTDIDLLCINANNKVNVGNSSYLTDVNGSTIQLYNSPTEKVIIGGGNISTEVEATTDRYVRVKNSNGEVGLYTSTNRGLYDTTLGKWIINTIKADSTVGINGGKVTIDNNGNLVASGDVTAYSDARLKTEIKPLEYRGPLEPKTYIKDGKKSIGFIAQEVRELYPELVLGEESDTKYLSLNYGAITAVLAAENKKLHKKVESLEERIVKLETLINKLIEVK